MKGSCAYCGAEATDVEHVLPRAYLRSVQGIAPMKTTKTVPSCHECNAMAEASVFKNFTAKRRYIKRRLARRHRQLLAMPRWTERELAELSPLLRLHVEAALARRAAIVQRLNYHPPPQNETEPERKRRPLPKRARARQVVPPRLLWGGRLALLALPDEPISSRALAAQMLDHEPSHEEVLITASQLTGLRARGAVNFDGRCWRLTDAGRALRAGLQQPADGRAA